MQFISLQVILKRIKAIRFFLKDKAVPKRKKIIIIAGIIYLISPIDFIPAVLFPVAWMDDALLWSFILLYLKDELDKYWVGEKTVDIKKNYRGKHIIDDVDFEIEKEKEQNKG